MPTDLDQLTVPGTWNPGIEIFDPVNAWPDAPAHITLQINPIYGGVYQLGHDTSSGRYWLRVRHHAGGGWQAWHVMTTAPDGGPAPPIPIEAHEDGQQLAVLVTFDLALDPASVPAPADFAVTHNTPRTVTSVMLTSSYTVQVRVSAAMSGAGDTLISYTAPASNALQSVDGVKVASFTDLLVTGSTIAE